MAHGLTVDWLGRVPYGAALARQEAAVAERRSGGSGDRLLLLEHPPVITLGRSARAENLLTPRDELARKGVALHEVARGGDVTYHGPGQLMGYTIVDLQARGMPDVHAFLRLIETTLIEALAELGVAFSAKPCHVTQPRRPRPIDATLRGGCEPATNTPVFPGSVPPATPSSASASISGVSIRRRNACTSGMPRAWRSTIG